MPAYDEDLAFIHDDGFSELSRAAARMLAELVRPPGLVADLGCGAGTLLEPLARQGFRVWGLDLSPAMVGLARRRVPQAHLEVGDALAARLPRAKAVAAVGEVLNYALAGRDVADLDLLLRRVRSALDPAGVLLFDVATTGKAQGDRHVVRTGRTWRVEARIEVAGDRLVRTIDTWRRVGRGAPERHTREVHRQRLLPTAGVVAALEAAGFIVEVLGGYDDYGFQEGWDGFLARPR